MLADLERLIQLQQIDDFVAQARRDLADHPDRVRALDDRLASARERVEQARQRLADNQAARRGLDRDLSAVQGRLARFKDQLMSVKTNREYQAMQKEIETAQHEVREFEDRLLERMVEGDEIADEIRRVEANLAGEQQAVEAERQEMARRAAELEEQLTRSVPARARLAADTDPSTLGLFEQVARGRRGVGVAEARDGHCTVCRMRLRPQKFNEIRRNDAVYQCDSCQRILYYVAPSPPAEEIQ